VWRRAERSHLRVCRDGTVGSAGFAQLTKVGCVGCQWMVVDFLRTNCRLRGGPMGFKVNRAGMERRFQRASVALIDTRVNPRTDSHPTSAGSGRVPCMSL
jgi:hypothetical protein